MSELFRLVYTSQNLLAGTEPVRALAVAEILATSQANNARVDVTGALLFNGGSFAQVLEGPRMAVEATFERIQRDQRHSDVNVLQCEPIAERGFANWSMAFVGRSPRGQSLWHALASQTGFDLAKIEGEDLYATLHAIVLAEEGMTAEDAGATPPTTQRAEPREADRDVPGCLDVDRLRAELQATVPERMQAAIPPAPDGATGHPATRDDLPAGATPPTSEAAVLRAALAEERDRTTGLRRDLDDLRIALALAEHQALALRRQHDGWADRMKTLALAVLQEIEPARDAARRAA